MKPKTSSVFEIDIFDTLMRDTKHLTTGTPKDKMNVNPIWSADNKWIAYTQQQAKGTDSNIFIAEVATGKSTLLTPHQGEQLYTANEFSPDGKHLLITSNAGNGYDNVGLLDIATKKIDWLTQDKWEIEGGNFSPDGKSVTWTANVDGNTDIYLHDLGFRKDHFPAAAQRRKRAGRARSPPSPATARACSTTTTARPRPTTSGSIPWPTASRNRSRIRWWRACAPRTWSSRSWCTIPAATASGPSPLSCTCPTTWRAAARTRPSFTSTAGPRRRP